MVCSGVGFGYGTSPGRSCVLLRGGSCWFFEVCQKSKKPQPFQATAIKHSRCRWKIDSGGQPTLSTIKSMSLLGVSQLVYSDHSPTIRTFKSRDFISSKKHIQSPWCHSTHDAIIHFNLNQLSQNAPLYWLLYPRLVGLYIPHRINQDKLIPANKA